MYTYTCICRCNDQRQKVSTENLLLPFPFNLASYVYYIQIFCPTLEYGSIIYSGAANTHLWHLDELYFWIEQSCSFVFQLLSYHWNTAIMELLCCLLAGEGHGNLQTYCPQFCGNHTYHSLIIFTPGTQLNIYVVLIPVISEHWTDSSVVVCGYSCGFLEWASSWCDFAGRGIWLVHYI